MPQQFLDVLRAMLATTPARWLTLVQACPESLLTQRPLPEEWSAHECLKHLWEAEVEIFPKRVQHFLNGEDFAAFNPDDRPPATLSTHALAKDFAARRTANLAMFDGLTTTDLERTARHSALGVVTLGQMLHEWAAHDIDHTIQAERALMQPLLPEVGPWRRYFKANDMAATD